VAAGTGRPVLPPGIPQHFVPVSAGAAGDALVYVPMLMGAATVRFADKKAGVDATEDVTVVTTITAQAVPVRWEEAAAIDVEVGALESAPREPARYAELPAAAAKPKRYETWARDFATWLARSQTLDLVRDPASGQISRAGESERDFRIRLGEAAREQRDARAAELRKKYGARMAAVDERLRRAQQGMAREQEQVSRAGIEAAISVGASILGAVLGRKTISVANVGRATTAARGAGRVLKERQDVGRAQETVAAVQRERDDLDAEFQAELAELETKTDPLTSRLEPVAVKPKKADVSVRLVTLAWAPHRQDPQGGLTPAWT
jgi:hypothetical protein